MALAAAGVSVPSDGTHQQTVGSSNNGLASLITQVQPDNIPRSGSSIVKVNQQMAKKLQDQLPTSNTQSSLPAPSNPYARSSSSDINNNSQASSPLGTANTKQPSSSQLPITNSASNDTRPPPQSFMDSFFSCLTCFKSGSDANDTSIVKSASQASKVSEKTSKNTATKAGGQQQTQKNILKTTTIGSTPNASLNRGPVVKSERKWLLKPLAPEDVGKKCLVLDLDETLVHSSFKPVPHADFIIPVEIDGQVHNVYVLKRPGVDQFLQRLGSQFEIVVFTASLAKYADPVLDMLDKFKVVKHRLFRESCINHKGSYVKDLSMLGRDLTQIIIIDNAPVSYIFHPSNAIPIASWFNDPTDTELLDLIPFLEDLKMVDNVTTVLDSAMNDA